MFRIFGSCRSPWLCSELDKKSSVPLSSKAYLPASGNGSADKKKKKTKRLQAVGTCILAEMVINVIVQLHLAAGHTRSYHNWQNVSSTWEGKVWEGRPTGFRHVVKQTSCKPNLGTASCPKFCRFYHNLIRLRVRGHKIWFRGGLSRSTAAHPRHVSASKI